MPNKLKDLKITSTDLVNAGANPDAHIRLFKRKDAPDDDQSETLLQKCLAAIMGVFPDAWASSSRSERPAGKVTLDGTVETVLKDAKTFDEEMNREHLRSLTNEAWNMACALSDSWSSIICDSELSEDDKRGLMFQSLDEFAEAARNTIPNWVQYSDNHGSGINVDKSTNPNQKEETENMKFDKSKMTPDEQATLAEFEKKYGDVEKGAEQTTAPTGGTTPDLHPEVKKALDDNAALAMRVEELTKSLEIKDLTAVAKKYELIGKKPDELAQKLYGLKKAGGTAYEDTIALLDEQIALVEKSGLFGEFGRNTSGGISVGGELDAKASEIKKANTGMSEAEAFAKAYETYPDLAAQYEQTYKGRA